MRLTLHVATKDDAMAALRAILYAIEQPSAEMEAWRQSVGRWVGVRSEGRYWTVKTTALGYSVRESG